MKTDILIIGSGCAGLYAALHLPSDKQVTVITKSDLESSDSFLAQGGICMLRDESDYDDYFHDTMKAGHYENMRKTAVLPLQKKALTQKSASCSTRTLLAKKLRANCWRVSKNAPM